MENQILDHGDEVHTITGDMECVNKDKGVIMAIYENRQLNC